MKKKYNFLLVGGCPRSGSTILNLVLNSNPTLGITNEHNIFDSIRVSEGFFRREDKLRSRGERTLSPRELEVGLNSEGQAQATVSRSRCQRRVLEELLLATFSADGDVGLKWLGDKFPTYYRDDIEQILRVFPDVHVIHVTRSVLHCLNSNLFRSEMAKKGNDWFAVQGLEWHLQEWIDAWNSIYILRERGIPVLHIKYEKLISDPSVELERISDFLGVECNFEGQMIKSPKQELEVLTEDHVTFVRKHLPAEIIEWEQDFEYLANKYRELKPCCVRSNSGSVSFPRRVLRKALNRFKL